MKKVLYILNRLADPDLDWMVAAGRRERLKKGTRLIEEGGKVDAIYVVIDGRVAATAKALGDKQLAVLASGEVVGELSFLDSRPPTATVTVIEDATVLKIPRTALRAKLDSDPAFAARFYHALGVFLADRLRSTITRLSYKGDKPLDEKTEYEDELDPDVLDGVALAGRRFTWMMSRLRGE